MQADSDDSMDVALAMQKNLQVLLQLQTNVGDERIPYSSLRATSTIIIADANAGFATTKHDWCGIGAFLQSYAQYRDVHELNKAKILDFAVARSHLGLALTSPERDTTFHIFWSLVGSNGRSLSHLQNQIVILREIVENIVESGHIPYVCLDMATMEEWGQKSSNLDFSKIVEDLRGLGALVESLDTFWTERTQLSVAWDSNQGVAYNKSGNISNILSDSLDASTSSEEAITKHFDPLTMTIPTELVPLCNLYDRHILRQKVIIQLSVPISEQGKIRSSGGDVMIQGVDKLKPWYMTHRAQQK